jgi:hypothetical protein
VAEQAWIAERQQRHEELHALQFKREHPA